MYKNFGPYNPFTWHKTADKVRSTALYKLNFVNYIVYGTVSSAVLVDSAGAETAMTLSPQTWTLKEIDLTGTRVTSGGGTEGDRRYIKMVIDGDTYYSDWIQFTDCYDFLSTGNSCSNNFWPWETEPGVLYVHMPAAQQDTPTSNTTYVTIITAEGEQRKVQRQITRQNFWFLQPKGFGAFLDGLKNNDTNYFNGTEIKNFDWESSVVDTVMAEFKVSFEYINLQEGDACCEDIDLDTINSPDGEGSGDGCNDYAIEIVNTDDQLTVTFTDEPEGTKVYRWYKDGVFISGATYLDILTPGNYRVDVIIDGCKATASYFKDNVCALLTVRVYASGNFVNADISNVPDGCVEEISVILNGTEVATSLPFEVSETGTYFVRVTACDCVKSGGVFITFNEESNCDFTVDIDRTGNTLTADTDASTPTYLWEYEEDETGGRVTIGTGSTATATGKGVYWLTVTEGTCSKETYIYLPPTANSTTVVLARSTGTEFTTYGISLLNVVDYVSEIEVTVNGSVYTYVSGVPSLANTYGVKADGKLLLAFSQTNATIIIRLI